MVFPRPLAAALAAGLIVAHVPDVQAQMGSNILRQQSRTIERSITRNTERLFKPRLVVEEGSTGPVTALALSPDEHYLVTAVGNNSVRVWDLFVGREVAQLAGHSGRITAIAVSPDGSKAATVGEDKTVRIWELGGGKGQAPAAAKVLTGHGAAVTGVVFTPGGDRLASVDAKGELRLWSVASGAAERQFQIPGDGVNGLAVTPDGSRLATAGKDGMLRLWDLASGAQTAQIDGGDDLRAVAVGRQGKLIAAGRDDGEIRVWNLQSGDKLASLEGHDGAVTSLALDDGGDILISGGKDKTLRRWSLKGEGRELGRHDAAVTFVALNKDDAFALSGSEDGTTHLWNLATGSSVVTLISTETGWAVVDANGRYDGNQQALAGIDWQADEAKLPIDNFAESYFEPALLPRALDSKEGGNFRAVKTVTDGVPFPPSVKIVSPKAGGNGTPGTVTVEVQAQDQGGGIAEVRLYRNGRLVADNAARTEQREAGGGVQVVKQYTVGLEPGGNVLAASALNSDKVESPADTVTLTADGAPLRGALHLITVGINQYQQSKLNLDYARPDAEAIRAFFQDNKSLPFTIGSVQSLSDGTATRDAIRAALDKLRNVPPQDVVMIYMAGHGVSVEDEWYFISNEIMIPKKPEQLAGMALSSQELKAEIESLGANRILLLLDTCHSGTAVSPLKDYRGMKALRLLARSVGMHVLAATDRTQYAVELENLGHGIFTYALLDALQGKADIAPADGAISARELIHYVEEQVPALSRRYADYAQFPTGYSRGTDFALSQMK